MIRRIVTSTIQKNSKAGKEFPARSVQWSKKLDCVGCNSNSIANNNKRYHRLYSNNSTISIKLQQQLQSPHRQISSVWFSTSISCEDDNDIDDDISDETSPPIGPVSHPKFAVVYHGAAYQKEMDGLHGQQLAIAQLEGEGKDEPDFDPFLEEELEEARLLYEQEKQSKQKQTEDKAKSSTTTTNNASNDKGNVAEDEKMPSANENGEGNVDAKVSDETTSQQHQYKLFRQKYNNDGSIKRNMSEMAILRAGAPAGGRIAILALGGTQYKVTTDDVLIVNLLKPVQHYAVGTIRTLTDEQVLLVSSSAMTCVGMPYVSGAEVDVMVEEITRDAKVIIFKKRRRKNSQRRTGFRRDVTMLRVLGIRFPIQYDNHEHTIRQEPAPLIPKSARKIV